MNSGLEFASRPCSLQFPGPALPGHPLRLCLELLTEDEAIR